MAPVDGDEYLRWRSQADETLAVARSVSDAGSVAWACFLCEQSAQFAVKGLLHAVGGDAWGHDLVQLHASAAVVDAVAFDEASRASAVRLSRHYIATRYPDAHPAGTPSSHYHERDAEDALVDAEVVLAAAAAAWASLAGDDE